MIKIRSILIFAVLPLFAGYYYASLQSQKPNIAISSNFNIEAVALSDQITLINQGNIISLAHSGTNTIPTNNRRLTEANQLGNNYIASDKQTNYSSLEEFNSRGKKLKTLLNGNTGNIDNDNWFTDPAVSPNKQTVAFVSDMDKNTTKILDNALFIENLDTGTTTKIADPDPHSGGIAHPVWNPSNPNIIAYDYYQYDNDYNPYSVIKETDIKSQTIINLTTRQQNAYQGSFSPNGRQFIFLGRNEDNTVAIYTAEITNSGLANVQKFASGNFAYPAFSNTPNHIYFLQAQGNSGYDLYTGEIKHNRLINISAITSNVQISADSGFMVNKL